MLQPIMPVGQYTDPFHIEGFEGMDKSAPPEKISASNVAYMMNCVLDEKRTPDKRPGFKKVLPLSLGAGGIKFMTQYVKADGTLENIFFHANKMYKWVDDDSVVLIDESFQDNETFNAFQMDKNMYIQDGGSLKVYDGTTVKEVDYKVPILMRGAPPTGGGMYYQPRNLATPYIIQSFSHDGSATVFKLVYDNLDAAAVTASIDGGKTFDKVETTNFTVDRVSGKVTWTSNPTTAGTDNVQIKFAKSFEDDVDKIKKCTSAVIYGGPNDTHVILYGNPDHISEQYGSGVYDPTYYPETMKYNVGRTNEPIIAYQMQYDTMVIEKLNSKYIMEYEINNDGNPELKIRPINDKYGCIARNSSQLINNNPVTLTEEGIYMLSTLRSNVRSERNVDPMSEKINKDLLKEANKEKAVSIDYDNRYIIAFPSGMAYIWDYLFTDEEGKPVWYEWDNINASCFLEIDNMLYFGSRTEGMIYRFYRKDETRIYNDDGQPIKQVIRLKNLNFGTDKQYKTIIQINYTLKPDTRASAYLSYTTEKGPGTKVYTKRMDTLNYIEIDYSRWSYLGNTFPKPIKEKPSIKNIVYLQLEFVNEQLNENMGINSIDISYDIGGDIK